MDRRRLLLGAAAVGGFLALDVGALLVAANTVGPPRLTQQMFVDAFVTVFGRHPGFRLNHAKGVSIEGHFDSTGAGRELSAARVFQPGRYPVTGRFSLGSGNPTVADAPGLARGLGLAFDFPDRTQWRTAMLNLPVFPDNSPQGFRDRLLATKPVAATGKPDPTAMAAFLTAHPETAQAMKVIAAHPPTPGFADSTYGSLITFFLVAGSGARTPVRWSLVPLQRALPPADGPNALFDALIRQVRSGPLRWKLQLVVGEPADPTDDATLQWPPGRRTLDAGVLTVASIATDAPGNARDVNFDPLVLPPGIEPSGDPLLSARSAVYAESYRLRTQQRATAGPMVQVDGEAG